MRLVQRPEPERAPRVHRRLEPLVGQRVGGVIRPGQTGGQMLLSVEIEPLVSRHGLAGPERDFVIRRLARLGEILGNLVEQRLGDAAEFLGELDLMRLQFLEEAALAPVLDLFLRVAGEGFDRLVFVEVRHVTRGQKPLPDMVFRKPFAPTDLVRLGLQPEISLLLGRQEAGRVGRAPGTDQGVARMKLIAEPG